MKKKFLIALLAMVVSVCCCFGVAACDDDENGWADGIFTVETAYAEAQELGYTGTLEEFIASISGTNGVGISAVTLNDDGELVVTLSDSTSLNLGVIKGADGEDGEDGATWYNGTYEAMNGVTANVGDYYLTTDTYAVYTYTADGWTLVIESIKGEDGAQGETGSTGATGETGASGTDGATWYTGEGAPSTETGTNGDLYLDTASYDIYKMTDGEWVKIGNIKGATGETGETGAQGETGSTGATGETGAAGTDGATWYTGEGAPSTETGTDSDLYLDMASYDIYKMTDGEWVKIGNIKGATGETGETDAQGETGSTGATGETGASGTDGATWYTGEGAPSTETGTDGDLYLDTVSYDIYKMTDGEWVKIGNIKGATGETGETGAQGETGSSGATGETGAAGTDGATWYTGEGAPSTETGTDGDLYLDTASYDIYKMTDGEWVKIGNIKGADGEDGEDGTDGEDLTATTVTITFDANGGEVEYETLTVTKGDSVDLPVPTRDGYVFTGWYYGTGANAGQVTDVTPISRDMTLVAQWEKIYELVVDYTENTTITESGYVYFEGIYESIFSSTGYNNITIEIELDGVTYSLDEAMYNGYISDCFSYNEESSFFGYIYFTAIGEYTVYLTYGYSSTSFVVTVNEYQFSGSVYVCHVAFSNTSYVYFDSNTSTSLTDVNTEDIYKTITVYFRAPSDATVSVTLDGESVDGYTIKYYHANYYVYITPKTLVGNEIGTYTFVVTVSSETYGSATATITYTLEQVHDFYYYYEPVSNVMVGDSTDFDLYYYGDAEYDYPVVTISDGTNSYQIECTEENVSGSTTDDCIIYNLYYSENNIYGEIYFYAVGNYTITIAFGSDSDSFNVTVTNFELNYSETEIVVGEETSFDLYYYGDNTGTMTLTITGDADYTVSYSSSEDWIDKDDETTYVYAWYDGYEWAYGNIMFYVAGTYTITFGFGSDSISYEVTVSVIQLSCSTEAYTDQSSGFDLWYYGSNTDTMIVTVTDGADYTVSYSVVVSDGNSVYGSDETSYVFAYYDGYECAYGDIWFYTAGAYTVTISFGDDSVSYTVTATDWVFEGDLTLNNIYWNGSSISDGYEVTGYTNYSYLMLNLNAPETYTITVTMNGKEASGYGWSWNYGSLNLWVYPSDMTNYTAGTYEITVTVSSEGYSTVTVTVTVVLEETPTYIEAIDTAYNGYGYDAEDGTDIEETIETTADFGIYIYGYASGAEVTITLDGTELIAANVIYSYDEEGYIIDCEIDDGGDYYYIENSDGYFVLYIYGETFTAGTEYTLVVTIEGTNGTATATLYVVVEK